MPPATTTDSDGFSAVHQELALLLKGTARGNITGDGLLQAFQDLDQRHNGYISSKSDVIDVLCDAIATKYQRRIDFNVIFKSFRNTSGRFDYTRFCEAFEKYRISQEHPVPERPESPTKAKHTESRGVQSPAKSPHKRSNWLIEHQQQRADDSPRDLPAGIQSIRLDPRLETQRLLSQNIRRKLLAGVIGAQYNGFKGIEELLFVLDEAGDGCLDDEVFDTQLLRRLKKPLTRQETEFLLTNLRVRTDSTSKNHHVVHYEHLATLCNLDSDASADETDEEVSIRPNSPRSPNNFIVNGSSDQAQSLGGADFLAAQKRLKAFFQLPTSTASNKNTAPSETPRSMPTGAEAFLEQAERIDVKRTGFLSEQDFNSIFNTLRLDISPGLVRAMLESFPRSTDHKIDYRAFLERYGEHPDLARERRKLKRLLGSILTTARPRDVDDWFQYLTHRFEKYDARLHKRPRGDVPQEEFVHVLRGSTSPLKLSVDAATSIATQFLRVSRSSRVDAIVYREFLTLARDCRAQQSTEMSEPTKPSHGNATQSTATTAASSTGANINVADYLIHDATDDERQHFELLMDTLHKFHQRIAAQQTATAVGSTEAQRAGNQARESQCAQAETQRHDAPNSTSTNPRVGEIVPIDNGILLALGGKLQVRVQFAVGNANLVDR